MGKLSIFNENHKISNIVWNVKCWKPVFVFESDIKSPDWIWMVDAQVIYIPFVLAFLANFKINKKGYSYWRYGNNTLPECTILYGRACKLICRM